MASSQRDSWRTVALTGGPPTALARVGLPRGAAWSKDNLILFSQRPTAPLVFVPATGGEPTSVPMQPGIGLRGFPWFLPDGRHYLYTEMNAETRLPETLMLASLDSPETRRLVATTSSGMYASGHLLFRRSTTLLAQPFDPDTLQLSGTPVAVAENVGFNPVTFQATFSVSDTGTIAYLDASPGAELVWFSRAGLRLSSAAPSGEFNSFCMTPDGRRVVYELADPATGQIDLWTLNLATSATTQLTFGGPVEFYPVCSPDAKDIVFAALKPNSPNLFRLSLGAPGHATLLLESPVAKLPTDWARDQRQLIYSVLNQATGWDIASWPLGGGQPRPLVATQAEERGGRVSPDGRWLAYVSNENGVFEVYVQPMSATGTKWLVSRGGGQQPQWSSDGSQLYLHRARPKTDGGHGTNRGRRVRACGAPGAHGNADHRVGEGRRTVLRRGTRWRACAHQHLHRQRPPDLAATQLAGARDPLRGGAAETNPVVRHLRISGVVNVPPDKGHSATLEMRWSSSRRVSGSRVLRGGV